MMPILRRTKLVDKLAKVTAEQRQIKAMALLEVEEAKQQLALLQAKLQRWYKLHGTISSLLAQTRRDSPHMKGLAAESRQEVDRNIAALREVMDLDAVLALDDQLREAAERVVAAEAERKRLGFS